MIDPVIEAPAPLVIHCAQCGHVSHYDACQAELGWWRRLLARRRYCCCVVRTWVAP